MPKKIGGLIVYQCCGFILSESDAILVEGSPHCPECGRVIFPLPYEEAFEKTYGGLNATSQHDE